MNDEEDKYIPLRFLLSDDDKLNEFYHLIINYKYMTDKEIYSELQKLYEPMIRLISVDLPAKDLYRTPETIKKDIKHKKNPMRLKQLNQELNKSYKIYQTRRK